MLTLKTAPSAASIVRIGSDEMALGSFIGQYAATFTRQFDGEDGAQRRIKSLYLYSESPGTGKTTTAAALLNEYLTVHYIGSLKRNRQALDRPAYFLDANAFQTEFVTFNRPRVPEETAAPAAARYYKSLDIAQSVPFLVMDDVGVREASDAFRTDLHAIINARVTNGLPTVYTSNLPMAELMRTYDARLADRIRDMCVEISFQGGSNRGMR
jgi:DNA replication protein DnaC